MVKISRLYCLVSLALVTGQVTSAKFYRTCTRTEWEPCPAMYDLLSTTSHLCVTVHPTMENFQNAQLECSRKHAELVKITDMVTQLEYARYAAHLAPSIRNGYAWLGLRYNVTDRRFYWIGGNKTVVVSSWATTPVHTQSDICSAMSITTAKWHTLPCTTLSYVICQQLRNLRRDQPGQPRLRVDWHELPNIVYDNTNLKLTCEAWVGETHTISWVYTEGMNSTDVLNDYKTETFKQRFPGGMCRRLMSSVLYKRFTITPGKLHNVREYITCVVRPRSPGSKACTYNDVMCVRSHEVTMKAQGAHPQLFSPQEAVQYTGRVVKFTCTACGDVDLTYEMKIGANITYIDASEPCITSDIGDASCGSQTLSILRLTIESWMAGATLNCVATSNNGTNKKVIRLVSRGLALNVKPGPQTPTLRIDYHGVPPYIVEGWNLTATCTACVGWTSTISWAIMSADHGDDEIEDLVHLILHENMTEEARGSDCGYYVTSYVVINVTFYLEGAQLVCFSSRDENPGGVVTSAFSLPFAFPGAGHHKFHMDRLASAILMLILLLLILLLLVLRKYLGAGVKKKRKTVAVKITKGHPSTGQLYPGQNSHQPKTDSFGSGGTNVDTGNPEHSQPEGSRRFSKNIYRQQSFVNKGQSSTSRMPSVIASGHHRATQRLSIHPLQQQKGTKNKKTHRLTPAQQRKDQKRQKQQKELIRRTIQAKLQQQKAAAQQNKPTGDNHHGGLTNGTESFADRASTVDPYDLFSWEDDDDDDYTAGSSAPSVGQFYRTSDGESRDRPRGKNGYNRSSGSSAVD